MASTAITGLLAKLPAKPSEIAARLWKYAKPKLRDRIEFRLRADPPTESEAQGIEHSAYLAFMKRVKKKRSEMNLQDSEAFAKKLRALVDTPIKSLQRERKRGRARRRENIEWSAIPSDTTTFPTKVPETNDRLLSEVINQLKERERTAVHLILQGLTTEECPFREAQLFAFVLKRHAAGFLESGASRWRIVSGICRRNSFGVR